MLPSVGYFKSIYCPYFENDNCERPFCQFRHEKFVETNSLPKGESTIYLTNNIDIKE